MFNHTKYPVRPDLLDTLDHYAQHRIPTGDFLEAVLSNNLMEAMGRADDGNRRDLFHICSYVYNELPAECHGSKRKVNDWLVAKEISNAASTN